MMLLLSSIQMNVVRSDVQQAVDILLDATAGEIADALSGNSNKLHDVLQVLTSEEQNQVAQSIKEQHGELFSGYIQSCRPLVEEDKIHFSRFRLKLVRDGMIYKSPHWAPYSLIRNETGEEIYTSAGWCRCAFSNDESLVAHYILEFQSSQIIVFNTNTKEKKEISHPQEKEGFAVGSYAFTADNRYLIITSCLYEIPQIYVYDLHKEQYCDACEDSFGGSILALNESFKEVLWKDSRFKATTSPCGNYISFLVETKVDDDNYNRNALLYLYYVADHRLEQVFNFDYPAIDSLPLSEHAERKVYSPEILESCFSNDGQTVAVQCQFRIDDKRSGYTGRDDRFKPTIIALFESASGKCCFKTEIDGKKLYIASLELNEDGRVLVANSEKKNPIVWQYLNCLDLEEVDMVKALFVYMLSKCHTEVKTVDLTGNSELTALLKLFTPESQLLLQQTYNIMLPKSYLKRLWNSIRCVIM